MSLSDAALGKYVLIFTLIIFTYVVIWLTVLPFTDLEEDHWFYKGFSDQSYALLFSALLGLLFIGSLMIYTLYQLFPVLTAKNK